MEKQRWGRVREEKRRAEKRREDKRREKIREGKESKERRCRCAKGRKVAAHCVFPLICGSGESTSRLAKAAGAEPSGRMRDEKLHAAVARSTCPTQNVQKNLMLGPLLEVEMSKKCAPLWREAHFEVEVNSAKKLMDGTLLDV